jgi:hypothetical protein
MFGNKGMSTEQQTQLEAQKEQEFFNKIVSDVEFWASVEDMTLEEVIDFHKHQVKNIKKRHPVTLKKIALNAEELREHQAILDILEHDYLQSIIEGRGFLK